MLPDAQIVVLGAWAVVVAVCVGIGLLERRVFGPKPGNADDLWMTFWMGFALLLSLLQVWHLFLPIDDRARTAAVVVAAIGWLAGGVAVVRVIAGRWRHALALAALMAPIAWVLSRMSMAGPRFGDVGLYLIPQILWFESFPSVPGLANLYVPFGYNLSYFLFAAMLDAGPATHRLYHTVNSALFIVLVARGVAACVRLVASRERSVPVELFYALSLIPVAEFAYNGFYLTSLMPDTAVCLFGIVLAGELVALVAAPRPARGAMLRIVFLSAIGVTLKLSLGGLAVATGLLAFLWWARRSGEEAGATLRALGGAAIVAGVPLATWLVRNVVTSGYPLYPASLLAFPVDWIARVDATAWIQRPMSMVPLYTIFTMWDWWKSRLVSLGWTEVDAVRPFAFIGVALVVFVVVRTADRLRGFRGELSATVLLAPFAAFWFSFANTPMVRYQGATLWIFGVELLVLALAPLVLRHRFVPSIAVVAIVAAGVSHIALRDEPWPELATFEEPSPPRIERRTLASGLVVGFPENQVCWYAELPCTPEPHPGLRLREPGNLAAGFWIHPDDAHLKSGYGLTQ